MESDGEGAGRRMCARDGRAVRIGLLLDGGRRCIVPETDGLLLLLLLLLFCGVRHAIDPGGRHRDVCAIVRRSLRPKSD